MELTIKIENKKIYQMVMQFLKSLGIKVVSFREEKVLSKKTTAFKALRVKTKGFSFNREEANER